MSFGIYFVLRCLSCVLRWVRELHCLTALSNRCIKYSTLQWPSVCMNLGWARRCLTDRYKRRTLEVLWPYVCECTHPNQIWFWFFGIRELVPMNEHLNVFILVLSLNIHVRTALSTVLCWIRIVYLAVLFLESYINSNISACVFFFSVDRFLLFDAMAVRRRKGRHRSEQKHPLKKRPLKKRPRNRIEDKKRWQLSPNPWFLKAECWTLNIAERKGD